MRDVRVGVSAIAGNGVFATRDFFAGETVIRWHPQPLTPQQTQALSTDQRHFLITGDGVSYLMRSPEKYVNHSCDPNTKTEGFADVAIKPIKKGAEITTDYHLEGSFLPFECRCGSSNCRGSIGVGYNTAAL